MDRWFVPGRVLLVGGLALAIVLSWNSPDVAGREALAQANALLSDGRYSQAVALLEGTLLTYSSPELRLSLSYGYLARRDAERAERQARIALSTSPPHLKPAILTQLGRVLAFEGRDAEALDAWTEARNLARPYAANTGVQVQVRSAVWQSAMAYWRAGKWSSAQQALEALLAPDTQTGQAYEDLYARSARLRLAQLLGPADPARSRQLLALVGAQGGQAGQANLSQSRWAVPDLRVPGLREGLAPQTLDDLSKALRQALQAVEEARRSGADQAQLALIWGSAYLQQGEPALARGYLQQAVDAQPDSADAHAWLGLDLLELGDEDRALSHLQTAVRLDPRQPLPHHALARIYIQRRQWEMAARELRTLNDLQPASVIVHVQIAEYYVQAGQYDDAEGEYINAVNLQRGGASDSGSVDAMLALARFYSDVRGLGCEKGLPLARESLARHPSDPASLDAVGWSLVLCRRPAEALSYLEQAVALAPDAPRYRYHLAKAYAGLDRYAEARDQYTRVMDLDPGGPWELLAKSELARLRT